MNLVKFSDTKNRVDENGVLNIIVGQDFMLKISPAETIVIAKQVLQTISAIEKEKLCDSLLTAFLDETKVPEEVQQAIRDSIISTEEPIPSFYRELTQEEQDVINLIKLCVNEDCPCAEIDMDEINGLSPDMTIENACSLIEAHDFEVKQTDDILEVTMKG